MNIKQFSNSSEALDSRANPSFSVVIATHNRPEELKRAVASILNQSSLPNEIIIVDDASLPPVNIDLASFSKAAVPIHVIRNETAKGPAGARNQGIFASVAEWVAFLDDDDEFLPAKIQRLKEFIADDKTGIEFVYHAARIKMVNEGVMYDTSPSPLPSDDTLYKSLLVQNIIGGTPMVAVKRAVLVANGGFDAKLKALEDYELWIRLASRKVKFARMPEVLSVCYYTTKKVSVTKSENASLATFRVIESKFQDAYRSLSVAESRAHELWKLDTMTHKAILNLNYMATLCSVFKTLSFSRLRARYLALALAALIGPRLIIYLRARLPRPA